MKTTKKSQLRRLLYEIYRDKDVDRLYNFLQTYNVKVITCNLVGKFPSATPKTVALTDFSDVYLSNSRRFTNCRKQVAIVHEFLHIYDKLYGKNWTHDYMRSVAHAINPCSQISCDCTR